MREEVISNVFLDFDKFKIVSFKKNNQFKPS